MSYYACGLLKKAKLQRSKQYETIFDLYFGSLSTGIAGSM